MYIIKDNCTGRNEEDLAFTVETQSCVCSTEKSRKKECGLFGRLIGQVLRHI